MNANPIDRVPCEVWVKVLEYGCLEEALMVHDLSETFERACCQAVRNRMTSVRSRLARGVRKMRTKLMDSPASYDSYRMSVLKTVVLFRYLVTEMNIFFSTVWSYSEHVKAWVFLCPHLLPVINEFDNLFNSSMNLDRRREDFTTFNLKMLLNTYHEFLRKYDSTLVERLVDISEIQNFEIEAIDILLSCPSINFQLSLSCGISDERSYDISSFFGFYNLKPIFQVPDVHNSSLTNDMKKITILRYLRECVQWQNLTFLQSIINEINDLEFRIASTDTDNDMRLHLIMKLSERYEAIKCSPYPPLYRNIHLSQNGSDEFLKEHYYRLASCNANMTGLYVFIITSNQPPENLPLVVHHFRGQLRPAVEEEMLDSDELCNCMPVSKESDRLWKNSLQLCIHYREGFNSSPAESIIDVVYDHQNECHISSNYIGSEPFPQFNFIIDIEEE